MYIYIQGIRLQGHPPISYFTLLQPEKLILTASKITALPRSKLCAALAWKKIELVVRIPLQN